MISWILQGIEDAVWYIFIYGFLYLIDAFKDILAFLSNGIITDIFFKNSNKNFSFKTIPWPFFLFCIIAAAIICIIFITQYIILLFNDNGKVKSKLVTAIKMSALATVFVFFIPIAFFLLNSVVAFVIAQLNKVLGTDFSLAGMLYNVGDGSWDGTSIHSGGFDPPSNILEYNIMLEIFSVWLITIALVIIGTALIQKIFELFFLFIVGPLIAATMPIDDGKRMLIWKDLTIAKSISSLGAVVIYYTFTFGLQSILGATVTRVNLGPEREVLVGIIVTSGSFATLGITRIVNNIAGEKKGIRGQLANIASAAITAKALTGSPSAMIATVLKKGLKGHADYNPHDSNEVGMQKLASKFESSQAGSSRVSDRNGFSFPEQKNKTNNKIQRKAIAQALAKSNDFHIKEQKNYSQNQSININKNKNRSQK